MAKQGVDLRSVRGVIKIKVGQNLKGEVSCVKCFRKGKPSKS